MKTYTLSFSSAREAERALQKLRKRGVSVHAVIVIVSTTHWNKVKDLMSGMNGSRKSMVVVVNVS